MIRLKIILQSNKTVIFLMVLVLFVTFIRLNIKDEYDYKVDNKDITGKIIDYNLDKDKLTFTIKTNIKIKCNYYIKSDEVYKHLKDNIDYGYIVSVSGEINKASNNTIPNTFNYKEYLKNNNIFFIMNVKNIKVINKENNNIIFKVKSIIKKRISKYKSVSYMNLFILGSKNEIDDDILSHYQKLGVSHVFAISGMHVSLLVSIMMKLLYKLSDNKKYFIIIAFLLFYTLLVGLQASVLRSVFLFIFLYINKRYDFNIDTLNVLIYTVCFLLLIRPELINDIGFKYSSIISYSLIKHSNKIKGSYFMKCLKISLIALLYSIPITLYYNYEINILSCLNNLVVVPLISLVIYPLSLISLIIKPLDNVLFFILNIFETISKHLLILNITVPKTNIIFILIYYLIIHIFFESYNKLFLLFIPILILIYKYMYIFDNNYYIYYLDVSQGDASLIKYKGMNIMIDTGGKVNSDNYYVMDNIIKFYKSVGINKIDYLILSHGDYDHMGWSSYLINNFKVDNVILNNDSYNELEIKLIKILKCKNIKYYKGLKELNIDRNKLYFLNTKEYDNENDNSNVIYFKLNNYKFLFMGDAGVMREKDILNKYNLVGIDFIKIGHHGSNTSSSEEFIENIKPKNCLISVGKNNRYGHPKEEILDTIKDYCDIYRTDLNGSIEIKINKNNYKIKTYRP